MLTIQDFVILGVVAENDRRFGHKLDLSEAAIRATNCLPDDPTFDARVALARISQLRELYFLEFNGNELYLTGDGRRELGKQWRDLKKLVDWTSFIEY